MLSPEPGADMRRREFLGVLGGTAVWPLTARAQQAMPLIGFVSSRSPTSLPPLLRRFAKGSAKLGLSKAKMLPSRSGGRKVVTNDWGSWPPNLSRCGSR